MPEAHVEGSVFGSILLAAFAMKFSLSLLLSNFVFLLSHHSDVCLVFVFAVLGLLAGTFALFAVSDFKKLSASVSILHMCFSMFLFLSAYSVDLDMLSFV